MAWLFPNTRGLCCADATSVITAATRVITNLFIDFIVFSYFVDFAAKLTFSTFTYYKL